MYQLYTAYIIMVDDIQNHAIELIFDHVRMLIEYNSYAADISFCCMYEDITACTRSRNFFEVAVPPLKLFYDHVVSMALNLTYSW